MSSLYDSFFIMVLSVQEGYVPWPNNSIRPCLQPVALRIKFPTHGLNGHIQAVVTTPPLLNKGIELVPP